MCSAAPSPGGREAACGIDNDGAGAVAGDIGEHGGKARAGLDVISAADGGSLHSPTISRPDRLV